MFMLRAQVRSLGGIVLRIYSQTERGLLFGCCSDMQSAQRPRHTQKYRSEILLENRVHEASVSVQITFLSSSSASAHCFQVTAAYKLRSVCIICNLERNCKLIYSANATATALDDDVRLHIRPCDGPLSGSLHFPPRVR